MSDFFVTFSEVHFTKFCKLGRRTLKLTHQQCLSTTNLASPKSATLTTVFLPTRQLRAARSRWMKPCASRYSIARQTCRHHITSTFIQLAPPLPLL